MNSNCQMIEDLPFPVMRDWKHADSHLPEIKAILAQQFIHVGSIRQDVSEGVDLVVGSGELCACRVRKHRFEKHKNEITIRCIRPSGAPTELIKILNGSGDYIFYAIEDAAGAIGHWIIGDLAIFRDWWNYSPDKQYEPIPNYDGTAFLACAINTMAPEFIVARGFGLEFLSSNRIFTDVIH